MFGLSITTIGLIFQSIGSILLIGGYIPQIIKLKKTKVATGISKLFWLMIATGCTAILINMIIKDTSLAVIFTQALNAFLAWYTLLLVLRYRNNSIDKDFIQASLSGFLILMLALTLSIVSDRELSNTGNYAQVLGTVALLTAYLPQIVHLFKVKNANGLSVWLFIVLATGLLFVTANMIITETNIGIIVTELVNIALIEVMAIMTIRYQKIEC